MSATELVEGMMLTETDLGGKMRQMMEDGMGIPDELVEKLVCARLRERHCASKVGTQRQALTGDTCITEALICELICEHKSCGAHVRARVRHLKLAAVFLGLGLGWLATNC